MIPEFVDGVLPAGLYECILDEVEARFGVFSRSTRRLELTGKLRAYVAEARKTNVATAVILDGSYVTAKAEPNDIDLILVLRPHFDLREELRPFEYNIQSRRMVRRLYGFDVRTAVDQSDVYQRLIDFFTLVRASDPELRTVRTHKGLLRVAL